MNDEDQYIAELVSRIRKDCKAELSVARDQLIKEAIDAVTITLEKVIAQEQDHQGKLDIGAQIRVPGMKRLAVAIKKEIRKL